MDPFKQRGYPAFNGLAKIEYIKQGATNRGFVSLDPERQPERDDEPQRNAAVKGAAHQAGVSVPSSRVGGHHSTGGFSRGKA